MEKATKATKANEANEATIDKGNFAHFLKANSNSDGNVRAITINSFVDWFDVDGKRVRSFIRNNLKLNAPTQQNGAVAYVFKANDPIVRQIFDRFANGAQSRKGARVAYDEKGFLVKLTDIQ